MLYKGLIGSVRFIEVEVARIGGFSRVYMGCTIIDNTSAL